MGTFHQIFNLIYENMVAVNVVCHQIIKSYNSIIFLHFGRCLTFYYIFLDTIFRSKIKHHWFFYSSTGIPCFFLFLFINETSLVFFLLVAFKMNKVIIKQFHTYSEPQTNERHSFMLMNINILLKT